MSADRDGDDDDNSDDALSDVSVPEPNIQVTSAPSGGDSEAGVSASLRSFGSRLRFWEDSSVKEANLTEGNTWKLPLTSPTSLFSETPTVTEQEATGKQLSETPLPTQNEVTQLSLIHI